MQTDIREAAYFEMRTDTSLQMARAATSRCAQIVHEELANRYRAKLATVRDGIPSVATDMPQPLPASAEIPRFRALAAA